MVHIWQCSTSKYLDLIFNGKHFWKFEFLRKKIPKYNFDFTWLANHVPYGSALKLYSKMIFSCLRINSNRAEILKSTPLLSSIKYKNDSLCLYTLYNINSLFLQHILLCFCFVAPPKENNNWTCIVNLVFQVIHSLGQSAKKLINTILCNGKKPSWEILKNGTLFHKMHKLRHSSVCILAIKAQSVLGFLIWIWIY